MSNHRFNGDSVVYAMDGVEDATATELLALAKHLNIEHAGRTLEPQPEFWREGQFRLFVSHLAEHKLYADQLRDALEPMGVSAFVAHSDIRPTTEWQGQIEAGLATADAMVALMHPEFHRSNWTDQELGYAMGRDLLVVAVHLGQAPYGFVERFQAVAGSNKTPMLLARELAELLVKHKKTGQRMTEALVTGLEGSASFKQTLSLMPVLKHSQWGSADLAERCLMAIEANDQIRNSYGQEQALRDIVEGWTTANP